jgi:hypothetical protein
LNLSSSGGPPEGWRHNINNRPDPSRGTFLETYPALVYWQQIVVAVRTYARQQYNREILISANNFPRKLSVQHCAFQFEERRRGMPRVHPAQQRHVPSRQDVAAVSEQSSYPIHETVYSTVSIRCVLCRHGVASLFVPPAEAAVRSGN